MKTVVTELLAFLFIWISLCCGRVLLTGGNRPSFCSLPKETGLCRGAFPRWYYNINSDKCEMFTYGGCGGNKNNFDTRNECEGNCITNTSEEGHPSQLPKLFARKNARITDKTNGMFRKRLRRELNLTLQRKNKTLPRSSKDPGQANRESEENVDRLETPPRKEIKSGESWTKHQSRVTGKATRSPPSQSNNGSSRVKATIPPFKFQNESLSRREGEPNVKTNESQSQPPVVNTTPSPPQHLDANTTQSPPQPPDVNTTRSPPRPPDVNTTRSPPRPPDVNTTRSPPRPPDVNTTRSPPRPPDVTTSQSPPKHPVLKITQPPPRSRDEKITQSPTRPPDKKITQPPIRSPDEKITQPPPRSPDKKTTQSPPQSPDVETSESPPNEDAEDDLEFSPLQTSRKNSAAYPYEHTSSHFAAFFLTSIVMVFAAYVVYHNRQKIIAIVIEGRSDGNVRRRGYRKLETSVEEAMPSLRSSNSTYVY